jgi:hypothetical protein
VTTSAPPYAGLPSAHLPDRLAALATLADIAQDRSGPGGFSPELVTEAESLLVRAGERLRLSAAHTVVTLAGGTGSGKSSLFNALAGACRALRRCWTGWTWNAATATPGPARSTPARPP